MKNIPKGLSHRLDDAEGWINGLDDRVVQITQ